MSGNLNDAQILSALPNGSVSIFDRELRYVYAAGEGLSAVGLTPEYLVGKSLDAVFPPEAVALVTPAYRRAFTGSTEVVALPFFHRTYSLSAAPFARDGDSVTQIVVVAQDVTGLVSGDVSRVVPTTGGAVERRDLLLAGISHELRNPLGVMRMGLTLLRSDKPQERERAIGLLERQVAMIESLTQDLTEMDRAPSGVLPLRFETIDVPALIHETVDALSASTEARGRISLSSCEGPLHMRLDRSRVSQVIVNLLTNAVRYTPAGAPITVTCARQDTGVNIAVSDTGIGIDATELSVIFEPFRRGRTAKNVTGSGLGLWVAREIALLHGGDIGVGSAGPGQGATFTLRLPLALVVEPS